MPKIPQAFAIPAALLVIANISANWYKLVSAVVPEPYLDEFFHVPQAQRYCNKDYTWDPKITTPPGLYLASLLIDTVAGCDITSLRALNVGAICLICLLAYLILRTIRKNPSKQAPNKYSEKEKLSAGAYDETVFLDANSALNISLFPPLFFFSALYYTDVMSTLVVLLNYYVFLTRRGTQSSLKHDATAVFVGLVALLFRQTNVFWVAVFPAGLALVDALNDGDNSDVPAANDVKGILQNSWSYGKVYDSLVEDARPQDYLMFISTVALAAINKPFVLLRVVAPYFIILGAFAGFVAWNGGVVLGDKSAHIATIHLPQMLYFWPYVVFFSIPLVLSSILAPIVMLLPSGLRAYYQSSLTGRSKAVLPGLLSATIFLLCGLVAVHYNTIVHPYTLADNRHYVFYVFRILRRHPAIKYLAVPIYYICAWLTIQTLGTESQSEAQVKRDPRSANNIAPNQLCRTSFVVIWIATTTLSVATAPLVEPRYFIIPWIIWRLHVPYVSTSIRWSQSASTKPYELRLGLEILWFLIINAAMSYMFVYRGFSWSSEPGQIQRFIW